MKFTLKITDGEGEQIAAMTGFVTLSDLCSAALGVAQARAGTKAYLHLKTGAGGSPHLQASLGGIACESIRFYTIRDLLCTAEKELAKFKTGRKLSKARGKFLEQHGGYSGPLGQALFSSHRGIPADERLYERYWANDFQNVLQRWTELQGEKS